jgi:hypothetical protein
LCAATIPDQHQILKSRQRKRATPGGDGVALGSAWLIVLGAWEEVNHKYTGFEICKAMGGGVGLEDRKKPEF